MLSRLYDQHDPVVIVLNRRTPLRVTFRRSAVQHDDDWVMLIVKAG